MTPPKRAAVTPARRGMARKRSSTATPAAARSDPNIKPSLKLTKSCSRIRQHRGPSHRGADPPLHPPTVFGTERNSVRLLTMQAAGKVPHCQLNGRWLVTHRASLAPESTTALSSVPVSPESTAVRLGRRRGSSRDGGKWRWAPDIGTTSTACRVSGPDEAPTLVVQTGADEAQAATLVRWWARTPSRPGRCAGRRGRGDAGRGSTARCGRGGRRSRPESGRPRDA